MTPKQLHEQVGTVTVNVAPLLIIIGAVIGCTNDSFEITTVLDHLLVHEAAEGAGDGRH